MRKRALICLLVLFLCSGCVAVCEPVNEIVCYDKKERQYSFNDTDVLNIMVSSQEMADHILMLWESVYPNHGNALSFTVEQSLDYETVLQYPDVDVVYTNMYTASLMMPELVQFDERIEDANKKLDNYSYVYELNHNGQYFLPIEYEGMLFAYNKTMVEALGFELLDENNDYLIDALDTWEEVFEKIPVYKTVAPNYLDHKVDAIYPMQFNEVYSFYAFLTAGNFSIFPEYDAEKFGFETEEFISAMQFIQELGKYPWNFVGNNRRSDELVWSFESQIENQTSIFTMVGDWMYADYYQSSQGYELVYSKMPSYNGVTLSPLMSLNGFVIKSDKKASLANEFIRMMSSYEGKVMLSEIESIVPVIPKEYLESEEILERLSKTQLQKINAYLYSTQIPLIAFEDAPEKFAFDVYYEFDWMSTVKQVYEQALSPEEAAMQLSASYYEYLVENKYAVESESEEVVE